MKKYIVLFFKTCSESHNEKPLLKPILSTKVEVNRYLINSILKDLSRRVEFKDKEGNKFLIVLLTKKFVLIEKYDQHEFFT